MRMFCLLLILFLCGCKSTDIRNKIDYNCDSIVVSNTEVDRFIGETINKEIFNNYKMHIQEGLYL